MKLTNIRVAETKQSATNIKGRTEGKAFDELVASVKEKGILVPILVRKIHKAGSAQDHYEVIAGNRRLVAAKATGLYTIPAQIVEMTDTEAHEAQIVENLQREDIHPLDEGKAYRRLIEEAKYDTISIAAKVGKPEAYIKQRLFLTNLIAPAADTYREGKILDGHAVLIAKLATGDQTKALKITAYNRFDIKDLKEWIGENIYSPLDNQPWLGNHEAMKAVGPCQECDPRRMSLFGPVKEGACTSLKCWARKMQSYLAWRVKEGKLAKVSSEYGQAPKGVYGRSDYVQVAKSGKDRCKSVHGAIVIEGSEIGKELDICTDQNCQTHRGMKSQYGMTPKEQEARRARVKKENLAAKKAKEARQKKLKDALAKIDWPMSGKHLDALLTLTLEQAGSNLYRSVSKRHELKPEKVKCHWGGTTIAYDKAVKEWAKGISKTEKIRLAFELLIDTGYESLREGIGKLK